MTPGVELMSKLSRLSEDQQREVLVVVESLVSRSAKPSQSAHGLCADLRRDLSFEEFQSNRQELWGNASDQEL